MMHGLLTSGVPLATARTTDLDERMMFVDIDLDR